jgi:signal transduction histidine kinase
VDTIEAATRRYTELLGEFCRTGKEETLYEASLLSHDFLALGIPPDEIVAIHTASVEEVVRPNDARGLVSSQQLLLEVMIAYGVKYQQYAEMKVAEADRATALEHARVEVAERSERERRELLATISHELGTPLTVVKGNIGAIRRALDANADLAAELSPRALDVQQAVERMVALRDDLVAASRNEDREIELVPVNAVAAASRAVRWAGQAAEDKQITLSESTGPDRPYILGDADALQSIFGNLLSNAIRYTEPGGAVTVQYTNDGDAIVVEVIDNGMGLSPEAEERIFERFYRSVEARRMFGFGLGLGLALTKDLVEALGGTIRASNVPTGGANFRVAFPVAELKEE